MCHTPTGEFERCDHNNEDSEYLEPSIKHTIVHSIVDQWENTQHNTENEIGWVVVEEKVAIV